eukprot:m.342869 g.342869  ORF g.342869 m.342869 type:complete len:388 (+) comp16127_c4_seq1:68-1231(+)
MGELELTAATEAAIGGQLTEDQMAKLRQAFRMFDKDNSGTISRSELQKAAESVKWRPQQGSAATAISLMSGADGDSDGEVTFDEFVQAVVFSTNTEGRSTREFGLFVRFIVKYYVKDNDEETKDYLSEYKFCPPPIFILLFTIIEVIVYAIFLQYCIPPYEHPMSFSSTLAFRPACREQVWRFLTYMLVHASASHITFNCLLQVIVGVPLEMVHGPFRMLGLYLMGAIAGSLASSVVNPTTNLVGASAAVYAIVGAHVADTFLNWKEMPFRWVRLAVLTVLVVTDLGLSISNYIKSKNDPTTIGVSYAGHLAGFMMGCTLGTMLLKNIKGHKYEQIMGYVGIAIAVAGILFAIFWNIFYDYGLDGVTCPKPPFQKAEPLVDGSCPVF